MSNKKNRNVIPMRGQAIGGQQRQMQINIEPSDVSPRVCDQCGHELFDVAYRYGVVSALSPKNPSGKDIPLKTEALICRSCGWEFGKQLLVKQ